MKKIILIIIIGLFLTGCSGTYSLRDAYIDTKEINQIIDDKILNDNGCIGVEKDYDVYDSEGKVKKNATTCKEGLEEFTQKVSIVDKKIKKLNNDDLKKKWIDVKKSVESEIPFIEKSIEIFEKWNEYENCDFAKKETEEQHLKCMQPIFDLKYSQLEKVLRGWVPFKAEEKRIHSEFLKCPSGSEERNSARAKLDEARELKKEYEKENGIYGNGNRLNLQKLLIKMFDADSGYEKSSTITTYGIEKTKFSSFHYDVKSVCIDSKDKTCLEE